MDRLTGCITQGVCLGSGIGNFDEIYNTTLAYEAKVRELETRLVMSLFFWSDAPPSFLGLQESLSSFCSKTAH